jgi:hypothetical protein
MMLDAPRGHVEWLGRLVGFATSWENKENVFKEPDGTERKSTSIKLIGEFKALAPDEHGELVNYRSAECYLPNLFAKSVRSWLMTLEADGEKHPIAEIDAEIGVQRATRPGIATYEWAIRSWGKNAAELRIEAIEQRAIAREERKARRRLLAGKAAARVTVIEGKLAEDSK